MSRGMNWNSLPKKYQKKNKNKKVYKPKDGEVKLVIPGELPTQNEIINSSKAHWTNYREMKNTWEDTVAWYAEKSQIPFFQSVKLKITYYRTNKRYDPDNIVAAKKIILDGLQNVGVLENDGWKEIKGFNEKWEVDKEEPRTEIIFEGVNNDN
jgi:hypothetical protein